MWKCRDAVRERALLTTTNNKWCKHIVWLFARKYYKGCFIDLFCAIHSFIHSIPISISILFLIQWQELCHWLSSKIVFWRLCIKIHLPLQASSSSLSYSLSIAILSLFKVWFQLQTFESIYYEQQLIILFYINMKCKAYIICWRRTWRSCG